MKLDFKKKNKPAISKEKVVENFRKAAFDLAPFYDKSIKVVININNVTKNISIDILEQNI